VISRSQDERWRTIAEQASKEMDRKKLTILVQQLCSALDERANHLSHSMSGIEFLKVRTLPAVRPIMPAR
jgi:hypothetical protein